jgi:hypothetical protein
VKLQRFLRARRKYIVEQWFWEPSMAEPLLHEWIASALSPLPCVVSRRARRRLTPFRAPSSCIPFAVFPRSLTSYSQPPSRAALVAAAILAGTLQLLAVVPKHAEAENPAAMSTTLRAPPLGPLSAAPRSASCTCARAHGPRPPPLIVLIFAVLLAFIVPLLQLN